MEQTNILPQLAKIAALLLLFLLVPFVPPSLRAPYLYLLFNALVLALGVQAGLLSVSGLRDQNKTSSSSPDLMHTKLANQAADAASPVPAKHEPLVQLREAKALADRAAAIKEVVGVARKLKERIRKCPSRASIFFIGSVDPNDDGEVVDAAASWQPEKGERKWWKADDGSSSGDLMMSKQELFTKAEAFIGNFYTQLKMQREESWNKLQDLYGYHHQHYKTKAI